MDEFSQPMIKNMLTAGDLSNLLPAALRPVERLASALYNDKYSFAIKRLSAFPTYATSQEQLQALLAGVKDDDAHLRTAFMNLCKNMAAETVSYFWQRRYEPRDSLYKRLLPVNVTPELAVGLSEEDAVDIIFPEMKVAFVGHDDFGCNALASPGDAAAFAWVRKHADKVGLYLLDVPST